MEDISAIGLIRVNTGAAASRAELEERIAEIMKKAGIESTPSMNEAYINLSNHPLF